MRGRKPNPNTKYKMIKHVFNNYVYAATISTKVENNKKITTYKHWGRLENSYIFIPNIDFEMLSIEEQNKYIFPENWDLSLVHAKKINNIFDNISIESNNKFDTFFKNIYNCLESKL